MIPVVPKFLQIPRKFLPVSTQKLFRLVPSNASKSRRGMTLIEMLITTVITGILAAVAIPSIMGLLKGNNVKAGLDQVTGSLREAQRQSIRLSLQCTVNFAQDTSGNLTKITASSNSCLPNVSSSLPTGVKMFYKKSDGTLDNTAMSISFSFKGNTTNSQTIIIASSDNKTEKRCLAISNGLGIMRTGVYNTPDCITSL